MTPQAMRYRLGLFVFVSFILLATLIVLFSGTPTFFRDTNEYKIVFDNAPNIGSGTPVRRSGVKIGEVKGIKLDDETGEVLVSILVDSKYTLRKNDRPALNQSLIGGDSTIDFVSTKAKPGEVVDRTVVEPGSTIQGLELVDARKAVQKATKLVPPTEKALQEIREVLKRFEKMAPLVEDTVKEYKKIGESINKNIPELEGTIKEYQKIGKSINKNIPELEGTIKETRKVAESANNFIPDLKKTNKEYLELAKEVRKTIPDLKKTNDQIQLTAQNWGRVGERVDVLLQTNEKKLIRTMDEAQEVLRRMKEVMSEENRRNVSNIIRNVEKGSNQIDEIARNTTELLKEGRSTLRQVEAALNKADSIIKDIKKATQPLGQKSKRILTNLDEATGQLNQAMGDVQLLLRAVGRSEGTIQKLLTDPSLYNQMDKTACGINKLLPRLDRILRDAETFADRIARHPEALGLRGVVNPSSGLKDLPPHPTVFPRNP